MDTNLSMQSWLDHLRTLSPPAGVVHVGAGNGAAAACYAGWGVSTAVFVEADERLFDKLTAVIAGRSNWSVHIALMSDREGDSDFYLASNPNENGTLVPESLTGLWRNLKTLEQCKRKATTLEALLSAAKLPVESLAWAVIDCLPALPVIQGAGEYLQKWDVIIARVIQDEKQVSGRGASKTEIDAYLSTRGYRCVAFEDERQPAVGTALYVRDWRAGVREQLAELEQQVSRQSTELADAMTALQSARDEQARLAAEKQAQLEQLVKARDEQARLAAERQQQVEQLTRTKEEQVRLIAERQAQLEQLVKARDEQARLAAERQQQVEQLTKAKEEQVKLAAERQLNTEKAIADSNKQSADLIELLKSQESKLEKMEKGLRSHFTKELGSSARQIEAFIGIDTYLSRGELLPTLHGWPVSPDFALYLINLIETNEYDLILEFGSGASTLLMAQTVLKKLQRTGVGQFNQPVPGSSRELSIGSRDPADQAQQQHVPSIVREHVRPSAADLLPRIISFEHSLKYYEESQIKLNHSGVAELVELNHTPLRDHVTAEGEQFLYYACEERIANVATLLSGRRANILVVVDGPPAATGKHARYPALPIMLQHLASHRLDVLLDDFNREEERQIAGRWTELLNRRSLAHEKTDLPFEKGACLLSIK
jgi:hypothetical protein